MENNYNVRAIERALRLLQCFSTKQTALSLSELSEQIELNKSTVFRIASTLESHHFLRVDQNGKYKLGFEAYRLGTAFNFDSDLKQESIYYMNELERLTGETSILVKYDDYRGMCIAKVESQNSLKIASVVGSDVCLLRGATGRAISSFLDDHEFEQCILTQEALHQVKYDRSQLDRDRAIVRENRFSISNSELDLGVTALAAPIFDLTNHVVGSISIAGPSSRFKPEGNGFYIQSILQFANEISVKLGYQADSNCFTI